VVVSNLVLTFSGIMVFSDYEYMILSSSEIMFKKPPSCSFLVARETARFFVVSISSALIPLGVINY